MTREQASKFTRQELDRYQLSSWSVRITQDPDVPYLGLCIHNDKVIVLNAHHIDIHPDKEVWNTIRHEVAHAIVGAGHAHDKVWADKAKEVGCDDVAPCSHLNLPPHIIDAIRSGANVEMTIEEEVITTIKKTPKYTVTRLQEKCPDCGKVAVEKYAIDSTNENGDQIKLIMLECFHILTKVIPKATPFETMVSNDWKDEISACKHEWNKNQCKNCGEFKLYNFQVAGARNAEIALAMQKGFGIFDEMGLGKTVQALAVLKFHKELMPCMIVTKSAITYQWFMQLVRWLGPDYGAQIIKTSRDTLLKGPKTYIIPYDLLRRFPRERLHKLNIKCVILDEVQQIKNPDSSRTQEVRKLVSANENCKVLELSGTPWKNRGAEFFPALNLLDPVKFWSYQNFLDQHVEYYYEGAKKKMGGIRNPKKFREYVANILIRREYDEVMDEFPEVNRMRMPVQLDELSQNTYDESTSEFVKWYNEKVIGGEEDNISSMEILAKLTRMRHITGLAKIPATLGFIEEFIEETDRKLVVFVHHKDVGQLLYNACIDRDEKANPEWHNLATELLRLGIKVFKYTSELSDVERYEMQEAFNNTPRAIMFASTLACGEGVNLQTCADSILHERQWNPANEDQATPGRFKRIGQSARVINVTVPTAQDTVDDHLDIMVEEKRARFHNLMNKSEHIKWNESDMAKELAKRIVAAFQKKNKGKTPVKTNITAMASR